VTTFDPWAPVHVLATQVRSGAVSSREATDVYLERIRASGELNAVVTVDVEGARRQADEADRAVRENRPLGPMHGVPITIKDIVAVEGVRTTNGEVRYRDYVPDSDAVAVARLRSAGAVIVGKTNTPPNGADVVTHNDVFGVTRNPWDLSRTPGGSSGGSAAAVAAALSALDLGGDIGGSCACRRTSAVCSATSRRSASFPKGEQCRPSNVALPTWRCWVRSLAARLISHSP
jgi:amidase